MNIIAEHLDHDWVKTGPCVYCDPCGVRLYQGDVCTDEEKAAMAALFDAAVKASTVDPPGTNGQPCGAGHICCDDPSSPPLHDHFLSPDQCVRCVQQARSSTAGAPTPPVPVPAVGPSVEDGTPTPSTDPAGEGPGSAASPSPAGPLSTAGGEPPVSPAVGSAGLHPRADHRLSGEQDQ